MASSEFARVIFHTQKDTFPPNADVTFEFEITPQLEASKWDWIGIFPVGWKNINKEYHTYQWVSLDRYENGQRYFTSVTFEASALPQDRNFYQICYVSSNSRTVCGASDAIQFLDSVGRDFVALECDDMTVIRGKSDVMQEEIQSLAHKLMLVNKEREGLQQQVMVLKQQLEKREKEVKEMMGAMDKMFHDNADKQAKWQALEMELSDTLDRLNTVQEERDQLEKALKQQKEHAEVTNESLVSLRTGIRDLLQEKDALSGENQSLKDERDSYMIQVTESQTKVSQQSKTIEKLNEHLALAQNKQSELVDECERHKATVSALREQYKDHEKVIMELVEAQKSEYELTAEVANCNDKLAASEALKKKLIADLEAYEQTQQKMSTKFENQESLMRSMQAKLEQKTIECAEMTNRAKTCQVELEHKTQEEVLVRSSYSKTQSEKDKIKAELVEMEKEKRKLGKVLEATMVKMKEQDDEGQVLRAQLMEIQNTFHQHSAQQEDEITALKQEIMKKQAWGEMMEQQAQKIKENVESLGDMQWKLEQSEDKQLYLQEMNEEQQFLIQELRQTQGALQAEIEELQKAVEDREAKLQQQQEQEEASHFCLTKANVALTTRVHESEKAMAKMKQALADEVSKRHAAEEVSADLRQRLEMGKLEYGEAARENIQLAKRIKQLERKLHSRAYSMDGGSDSDVDPYMPAYSDPYRLVNRIKKMRAVPVKSADNTSTDSEREEDSRPQQNVQLKFGNPYSNTENTPPSQQTIIRSTLEEEPVARKSWEETETETEFEESETEGETETVAEAKAQDNPLTTETQQEESEGKELPPPMQPQVVGSPAARDVTPPPPAVEGAEATAEEEGEGGQEVFEDCDPAADDSFLDAIGEGMKICMICHACILAPDDYEKHMAEHVGRVCPICKAMADDAMTLEDFQQHVNKCLDQDSNPQSKDNE